MAETQQDRSQAATPVAILKALSLPTTKGGAKAEKEYADWHRENGTQRLRRKYRGR